jgi:hypothetical protein
MFSYFRLGCRSGDEGLLLVLALLAIGMKGWHDTVSLEVKGN